MMKPWLPKACTRATIVASIVSVVSALNAAQREELAPLATPIGITIQVPVGTSEVLLAPYRERKLASQYYADERGMALYTYDNDGTNHSTCYDECARAWPPLIAPRGAKAFGEWSLTKRKDGRKQWSYRGRPLYTCANDRRIGEPTGAAPPEDELDALRQAFFRKREQPSDGESDTPQTPWRVASYALAEVQAPVGITVEEVVDAYGEALVAGGKTLYTLNGVVGRDDQSCSMPPCATEWTPLPAPLLASPVGHFTAIDRTDGTRQWAYKGKGLYTFKGDLSTGDAKGVGVDVRWQPALVKRFYLPAQVRVQNSLGHGKVLTTQDGMTLYRHTQSSTASLPRDVRVMPEMGRLFGTRSCDLECTKTWLPLEAPRGARPSGFWEVLTRDDGRKQWSYKGYALYRYTGDAQPGDVRGNNVRTAIVNHDLQAAPDPVARLASEINTHNQILVMWSHMYP